MQRGMKKSRFFTNISLYLRNDALPIAGDSGVASVRVYIATQLNSTELNSTSSCVAINGPKVISFNHLTFMDMYAYAQNYNPLTNRQFGQ